MTEETGIFKVDLAFLLQGPHLAPQAAAFAPLVPRQVGGLAPALIGVRLTEPVAQHLGRDPPIGRQRGDRRVAARARRTASARNSGGYGGWVRGIGHLLTQTH